MFTMNLNVRIVCIHIHNITVPIVLSKTGA